MRVTNRRDKYARSLGARDDENLSRAISWLTDLMQMERQRRGRIAINADVRDEVVVVRRRFLESKQHALRNPVGWQSRGLAHQHLGIELVRLTTVDNGRCDVGRQPREPQKVVEVG